MIYFYSGTPGSGKSYHAVNDIYTRLRRKDKNSVITNIQLDFHNDRAIKGNLVYLEGFQITVDFLKDYALNHHNFNCGVKASENQTLVVVDECQLLFNTRTFGRKDRMDWISFFTNHRHYGYTFILIAQFDKMIDKQIRCLFEYEIKHRKVNNYKFGRLFPVPTFCALEYWYGTRERCGMDFYVLRSKISKMYNSISLKTVTYSESGASAEGGAEVPSAPAPPTSGVGDAYSN